MNSKCRHPDAEKALAAAVVAIHKQYGPGAIMRLDGSEPLPTMETVPTGSIGLDLALGVGGIPKGRMVEVFGPESSGKTTLALHMIASVHAAGGTAAFIDAEHALDVGYAAALGVRLEDLLISQPDSGEQALELTECLIATGALDLVVIDSVAALTPRAELEGDIGDHHMGLQARMMSKAMRKLTALVSRTGCTVLFINQLRQKIGVTFGPKEVTTGGNALKYYTSVRLDIRRIGQVKQGERLLGNRTRVRVVKNKVSPPFRTAEFDIVFGTGISREGELLDLGESAGVLSRTGSWYSYGEHKLGHGREKAREHLIAEPERALEIETRIREALSGVQQLAA
jgi:recombination protein RecA